MNLLRLAGVALIGRQASAAGLREDLPSILVRAKDHVCVRGEMRMREKDAIDRSGIKTERIRSVFVERAPGLE
jgi:hypothetical protein